MRHILEVDSLTRHNKTCDKYKYTKCNEVMCFTSIYTNIRTSIEEIDVGNQTYNLETTNLFIVFSYCILYIISYCRYE